MKEKLPSSAEVAVARAFSAVNSVSSDLNRPMTAPPRPVPFSSVLRPLISPRISSLVTASPSLAEISSPSANLSVAEPQPPVAELQTSGNSDTAQNTPTANIDFATAVEQYEKKLIEEALQHSKNLREAGKLLNVNASTVSRKIKQYHIDHPSKK